MDPTMAWLLFGKLEEAASCLRLPRAEEQRNPRGLH